MGSNVLITVRVLMIVLMSLLLISFGAIPVGRVRASVIHHRPATIAAMIRVVMRTIDVTDPSGPLGVIVTAPHTSPVNDDALHRDLVPACLRVHIVASSFVVGVRVIAPPLVLVQDIGLRAVGPPLPRCVQLLRPPNARPRRPTNPDPAVALLLVYQHVGNGPVPYPPLPLNLLMIVPCADVSKLVSLVAMVAPLLPNRIRTCGPAQGPPPLLLLSLPSVLL